MSEKQVKKIKKEITNIVQKKYSGKYKQYIELYSNKFFEFLSPISLASYKEEEFANILIDNYKFVQNRKKNELTIRVFNPTIDENGWECEHTVIEIVCNDMPFIVDSITEELARQKLQIYHITHPIIEIKRKENGDIEDIRNNKEDELDINAESILHVQISYILDQEKIIKLQKDLQRVLEFVTLAVNDWQGILSRVDLAEHELANSVYNNEESRNRKNIAEKLDEAKEFLKWLVNKNFIFLGYSQINYKDVKAGEDYETVKKSTLGILKLDDPEIDHKTTEYIKKLKLSNVDDDFIGIAKSHRKSIVHRAVHMDYVKVYKFDDEGNLIGEHRFIGIFTSIVYFQSATQIPIIRKKIESIKAKSGFSKLGFSGKALASILEDLPRDELLLSKESELYDTVMGIVALTLQPRVRLFIRRNISDTLLNCMIFVPRDKMSTSLRLKMEQILADELQGTVSNHYTQITESYLARIQIILKVDSSKTIKYSIEDIEKKLDKASRLWKEDLFSELKKRYGEKLGSVYYNRFKTAFGKSYTNRFTAEDAYYDILSINKVLENDRIYFDLYNPIEKDNDDSDIFALKIYNPNTQINLSTIMPILDNMGLNIKDEHTYIVSVKTPQEKIVWIHRFKIKFAQDSKPALKTIKENFELACDKIWLGEFQDDNLNRLVIQAQLKWREVMLIRAYTKYIQQAAFQYSLNFVSDAICIHSNIVREIINLFFLKFDPSIDKNRENCISRKINEIEKNLNKISNLSEDRVIRSLLELVNATLRTNYFQLDKNGNLKDYISLKFDSKKISFLPKPYPYKEIFVYSSKVEGIHLRGGKVARGGLRWSDRKEDFRTEILGLVKAQITKNSVIIPVGSKGGFVVKTYPKDNSREAFLETGKECYKTFLRGLLDVTDNLDHSKVIKPKNVICYDSDDPYLVVAADKGTATFSDIANSISNEYNFWLGDAFASGGSQGYDHKKMGITAKGAWVSVRYHLRELGIDSQNDEFTVIGIGDMAGDVFGNGMLLSKTIRLLAAFNHMHIFIDPKPDAAKSYLERKRLFNKQRSTWKDYDSKLISKGGGIFERSAKSIILSKEIKELFNINKKEVTPEELIKYILVHDADLLWNGGIGTYVKSKSESHDSVGDKTNDMLRINGEDLNVRVVGEGGNLGLTQLGRIEYAKKGGIINTDAIDNSAGVDCSDHEVNIKIAIDDAVRNNRISQKVRNELLESMTDEVANLVLQDNMLQNEAITRDFYQRKALLETHSRLISHYEKEGLLDREIEFLPSLEDIEKIKSENGGLTRPEISVLLAYGKISLYKSLLESNIDQDDFYIKNLIEYFPEDLHKKFKNEILEHPLKKEIIVNSITNCMINRVGSSYVYNVWEETGKDLTRIAKSYTVAKEILDLNNIWEKIENLQNKIDIKVQTAMFIEIHNIVERISIWLLRKYNKIDIRQLVEYFAPGISELFSCLSNILPPVSAKDFNEKFNYYKDNHVPKELAKKIAAFDSILAACDIIEIATNQSLPIKYVGDIYFATGARFKLGWMRRKLSSTKITSYWHKLSIKSLTYDLFEQQRILTNNILKKSSDDDALEKYIENNEFNIIRYDKFIEDLQLQDNLNNSMMIVALKKVNEIHSKK